MGRGWSFYAGMVAVLAGLAGGQVWAQGWLDKVPFLSAGDTSGSAAMASASAPLPKGGLRGGQEGKTALVRVLDKQTNRLQTVAGQVGGTLPGVPVVVAVGRCAKSIGGVPGQDAAWLVIGPLDGDALWFEGWMFNTTPDVATLDHPRYDVQLVACDKTAEDKIEPVLPVIKVDEVLVGDSEAPKADGNDPYFVQGVGAGTVVATPDAEAELPPEPAPAAEPEAVDEPAPEAKPEAGQAEAVDGEAFAPAADEPQVPAAVDELHEMMDGMN